MQKVFSIFGFTNQNVFKIDFEFSVNQFLLERVKTEVDVF